jgi:hypothetical protein
VPTIASEFNVVQLGQVKTFLKRLQREGYHQEDVDAALRSLYVGRV